MYCKVHFMATLHLTWTCRGHAESPPRAPRKQRLPSPWRESWSSRSQVGGSEKSLFSLQQKDMFKGMFDGFPLFGVSGWYLGGETYKEYFSCFLPWNLGFHDPIGLIFFLKGLKPPTHTFTGGKMVVWIISPFHWLTIEVLAFDVEHLLIYMTENIHHELHILGCELPPSQQ